MPLSDHIFCPVPTVKLLGTMLRNRCQPTTFHTITVRDANISCHNWPVWLVPHRHNRRQPLLRECCLLVHEDVSLFGDGLLRGLSHGLPQSNVIIRLQCHQTFRLVPTVKLLGIMLKNRYWPTTFYTITIEDADGWCLN